MKIIYIDDDDTNRAMLSDMIALEGMEIVSMADARAGLALMETEVFDLILMDLRMPEMNGLTAIRHIRQGSGRNNNTPIVLVTADPSAGVRDMSRNAGVSDFLEKPVMADRLFSLIRRFSKSA